MPRTFEEEADRLSENILEAQRLAAKASLEPLPLPRRGESWDLEQGLAEEPDGGHTTGDPGAYQDAAAWSASGVTKVLVEKIAMAKIAARRAAETHEGSNRGFAMLGRFNAYCDIEDIIAELCNGKS